tara:strand:+ start:554 stop:1243 length:690 start_codon:yes stop_codon:yes gene_type:complete
VYDNEFRLIILLVGFFIIFYIVFINKSNRKYKVYKTKNYDIKKPIEIRSHKEVNSNKNIDISLRSSINNNKSQEISLSSNKPRQMSLSLGINDTKSLLVIYSIAKNHYNIKDIYDYMDKKSIFINDLGFYEKHYADDRLRCIKYSITNIVNPGYLDKDRIESSRLAGIAFFMQLPMIIDPVKVFNEMHTDAKEFSKKYKGSLYDSSKVKLNSKIIKNLKNTVNSYKNEY